jgi:hypothetical protein
MAVISAAGKGDTLKLTIATTDFVHPGGGTDK